MFPSARWTYALVGFVGCIFLYALRINLSVAIVCMVKTPQENNSVTIIRNNSRISYDVLQENETSLNSDQQCEELQQIVVNRNMV